VVVQVVCIHTAVVMLSCGSECHEGEYMYPWICPSCLPFGQDGPVQFANAWRYAMKNEVFILRSTGFNNENGTSIMLKQISFYNGQAYKQTTKAWVAVKSYTTEELDAMVGQVVMVDGNIPGVREGAENVSCRVWRITPVLGMVKDMLRSEGLLHEPSADGELDDGPIPF